MLKPIFLMADFNIAELGAWIQLLKYYWVTQELADRTFLIQTAHFFMYMDIKLTAVYEHLIPHGTPICKPAAAEGANACSIVQKEFQKHVPILNQRWVLFNTPQLQGETWTEFKRALTRASEVADIEGVTTKDWLTFLLLSGTDDDAHAHASSSHTIRQSCR
jgi:hypothetical protein